jgi:hypothetical protein
MATMAMARDMDLIFNRMPGARIAVVPDPPDVETLDTNLAFTLRI